ncbi:MAG: superoxide dismutase family protein [Acidimicrobiia bacterium]
MNRTTLAIGAAAMALAAAACGTATAQPAATTTTVEHAHDMEGMAMGDTSATRADDVQDADLVSGSFAGLNGAKGVSGNAWLARHDGGTTVTVELHGLAPGADFTSHVHAGSCADGGGPHYKFDPEGGHHPPNEIHLTFSASDDGHGFMTAENGQVAGEAATSVAVHAVDGDADDWLCADLE